MSIIGLSSNEIETTSNNATPRNDQHTINRTPPRTFPCDRNWETTGVFYLFLFLLFSLQGFFTGLGIPQIF